MIYNADGEILPLCIIHSGSVRDAVERYFAPDMWFFYSHDGQLSQTGLVDIVQNIEKYE